MGMRLARGYGDDCLAVMVRDPYQIYIYWTLTEETKQKNAKIWAVGTEVVYQLRVLQTDPEAPERTTVEYQADLPPEATGWYISGLTPGRAYGVQLGVIDERGQFVAMLDSGVLQLPPVTIIELDEAERERRQGEALRATASTAVDVRRIAGGPAPVENDPFTKDEVAALNLDQPGYASDKRGTQA
ncbi:DUF4912 domain-containing protein [Heliophilum fasciatum]|uniref:Uncharacterized protein DUF4912 n=1 Tax=Heliophilum fasciatum TaxID=35700 RepID=A0A4R2RFP4_9FIRM|nr:DUF4912 domain-containing protein [Heliophilum fasciatum]MCW2279087.1 hypothetical protein [Heliophilum fasciatum]TCP61484.1 uncharacterized protein DUF4912 [Heliophilum fasciatum]